jgi:CRP-like cAMP-binding protein
MLENLKRLADHATTPSPRGPSLRGVMFHATDQGGAVELLTDAQRQQLAAIAKIDRVARRTTIYREGAIAENLFIIGSGAVKAFRDLPSGKRRIAAFLFAEDAFGLSEAGRYVNSVQTITPVMVYRLDASLLRETFKRDSALGVSFLCKAVHELRAAQRHTILVSRRQATGRLAMLLRLLEQNTAHLDLQKGVIEIPMTRSDIANYLGLSLETVVRASRVLERQGIVDFVGRHHARILNRHRFEQLAAAF